MIAETIAVSLVVSTALVATFIPFTNMRKKFKMIDDLSREDQLMDIREWDLKEHGVELNAPQIKLSPVGIKKHPSQQQYNATQAFGITQKQHDDFFERKYRSRIAMDTKLTYYEEKSYGGEKLNEHAKLLSAPEIQDESKLIIQELQDSKSSNMVQSVITGLMDTEKCQWCEKELKLLQFIGHEGYYCGRCLRRVV